MPVYVDRRASTLRRKRYYENLLVGYKDYSPREIHFTSREWEIYFTELNFISGKRVLKYFSRCGTEIEILENAIENAGITTRNAGGFSCAVTASPVKSHRDRRGRYTRIRDATGALQRPDYVRCSGFIKSAYSLAGVNRVPVAISVSNRRPREKFRNEFNRALIDTSRKCVRDWWWWNGQD